MKNLAYVAILVLFFSCRKEQDTINRQNITGMVFNNCTDSGLANVKVYLQTFKDKHLVNTLETTSGTNGNFNFENAEIHESNKYSYAIHIPSKSGYGATTIEYCGFDGTTLYFSMEESRTFMKPRVTPRFLFLSYQSTIPFPILYPDSIYIYFEQSTFHKNVPDLPYSGKITNQSTLAGSTSNYPMGMWRYTINKWKQGVHTTTYDSIYLGWADTKTYTIVW